MAQYEVGVREGFSARHYLVGGEFGPEGRIHSHDYRVEVSVSGAKLDRQGFLVDIARLESEVRTLVERFRDQTLNDLPEFRGLNPGVEVVSRVMAETLARAISGDPLEDLTVKLWESESAWASCRLRLESS